MRRCESCHDAQKTHADWLPYTDRHMEEVACETCHIPQMYAPAIAVVRLDRAQSRWHAAHRLPRHRRRRTP